MSATTAASGVSQFASSLVLTQITMSARVNTIIGVLTSTLWSYET